MSKEEEIIEIIEKLQCEYKEQENDKKYNDYTVFKAKEYSKGLQGLLDLYNKEKEKNKKLQIRGKELIEEKQELNTALLYDNISKDKIREVLEKYKYTEIGDSTKIIEFYKEIQNLLKEE